MDGFELQQALNESMAQAFEANSNARKHGREVASVRAEYRAALASKMLELRSEACLPASMVVKVAEGDQDVCALMVELECAEAEYKADNEEVQLRKREADILREQIARDWRQEGARPW